MSEIYTIKAVSTGTKYGLSGIEELFACERKFRHLWEDKKLNFEVSKKWMQAEPKGTKNKPGVASMLCGSLFGAVYEAYFRGEDIPAEFRFTYEDQDVEKWRPNTCNEARRCFNEFKQLSSRSDFGQIIATEEQYETEFFGGPLTGAADIVIHLTQQECERLEEKFSHLEVPLRLNGEGVYLVDAKLYGRREEDRFQVWACRPQGKVYMAMHALKYGVEPRGFIYDITYKLVSPERELIFTPPVDDDDLKMIHHMVSKRGRVIQKEIHETEANPTDNCHNCFLFKNGLCRRY